MNVNLPREAADFLKNLVLQGRFESEEAAIAEGLRLLMSREKLKSEIQKGVKQLDEGEWFDGETVFRELNDVIDQVDADKRGS